MQYIQPVQQIAVQVILFNTYLGYTSDFTKSHITASYQDQVLIRDVNQYSESGPQQLRYSVVHPAGGVADAVQHMLKKLLGHMM